MLQHLLYVVSPCRFQEFKSAMERLKAEPMDGPSMTSNYEIKHRMLEGMVLHVSILSDIDGVTPYLRQHPVDLLIYDERGEEIPESYEGIKRIRKDVKQLAELWGPEFQFPSSRIVAILNKTADVDHRVFQLGRMNVRDVIVDPKNTALVLRWISDLLYHGIKRTNKVGLALSGGAIEGFLYQIGVIHGLNQALTHRHLGDVDAVSGVSSGSIAGSMVVGNIPIEEVLKSLHGKKAKVPPIRISTLFDFAGFQILRRFISVSLNMRTTPISQWLNRLASSVPTGFFKGNKLEEYFEECTKAYGAGERFSDLDRRFFVGVTDQDSFKHVTFGKPPFEHIPISAAVRASAALPPLYVPKTINGRNYIDGQITRSCNLESVIEAGSRLVFIIDPLKPFQSHTAGSADKEGGFYGIIQMTKALVSTRFEASLKAMGERYPDVDFMVFQPDEECAKLMSGSPLKAKFRTEIIEAAYRGTLRKLRERHKVYSTIMGRYGFYLKDEEDLRNLEGRYDEILNPTSKG